MRLLFWYQMKISDDGESRWPRGQIFGSPPDSKKESNAIQEEDPASWDTKL
jgi:hypothetical protein